ncbi:hypothetical protein SODALDRAFT_147502 [Sodiomyces alkalinus F11]|uniref:Uncharacterized protein n=1 Tax=Sodiomyces alkalinus (strain CBS 110278 / VKM F-3762 / F11) TaxID=1314773 RepID=A0A3N2PWK5_SODAK|nr:hypothetical protein SODALDRAFT_147502 [Sodiomyces alkalinus F11]ROT38888.1 hypothetical protein SODALDRAFT_147502 [Sodiomyces alkalinus F11]
MMWPAAESLVSNNTTPEPPSRRDSEASSLSPSPIALPVRPKEPSEPSEPAQPIPPHWTTGSLAAITGHHGPSLSSSPTESTNYTASEKNYDIEENRSYGRGKHRQSHARSSLDGSSYGEVVVDDSELMGAVLDGIGRITITMRLDSGGRWRIRRESSHLEWF